MRNLAECRAEIFRRSEMRIKARKKTVGRILAVCISLLLCAGGIQFYSSLDTSQKKGSVSEDDKGNTMGGIAVAVKVEIQLINGEDQNSVLVKKPEEVQDIYYSIQSLYIEVDGGNGNNYASGTEPGTGYAGYKIIFQTTNGFDEVFLLQGNTLTNDNTKETVELTEEQLNKLREILYITE